MGICNSEGIIYDFAGPYFVSRDEFAFGKPTRYIPLDPTLLSSSSSADRDSEATAAAWDSALDTAVTLYRTQMYNFFTNNCHSFCATALSYMSYRGRHSYNMAYLCIWMMFCGKYVSFAAFLKTYAGLFILAALVTAFTVPFTVKSSS
jgi:hypothetical protein